jgi:predicted ABC-type exoprotein transport system permease subunit
MSSQSPKDLTVPTASRQATQSNAWFPILVGVLAGMISWLLLLQLGHHWIRDLSIWIFNEPPDSKYSAEYYSVLRTILLVLCATGGSIGIAFSRWRTKTCVLFLSGVLLIIAVFAAFLPNGISLD